MNKLWSKRRTKRIEISHPLLTNLPKQSNEATIQALLARVRGGDSAACQKMVTEHMLLVKLKIQDFLGDYSYLKKDLDELVSVGVLACVEAVDRVKKGSMQDHDNITGYIRVAIWRFLGEWVEDYLVNAGWQQPLPEQSEHETGWAFDDSATEEGPDNRNFATFDDQATFEIKDILESLHLTEEEWYIIESRMVGDTNEEIAGQMGVTEFTVRFILSDIQCRFLEKYEDDDV